MSQPTPAQQAEILETRIAQIRHAASKPYPEADRSFIEEDLRLAEAMEAGAAALRAAPVSAEAAQQAEILKERIAQKPYPQTDADRRLAGAMAAGAAALRAAVSPQALSDAGHRMLEQGERLLEWRRRAEAAEAALNAHLCEHDAADWLACSHQHVSTCVVCRLAEAEAELHRVRAAVSGEDVKEEQE